ncbi:MAG TPA: APC family permease [Gaiellales bacterium]|jgi:amino acid transporter
MSEQAPPAPGGIFVRQSSGLVREFRPRDVFIFNTLGYALGLVLAVVPTFVAGLWPEQNVLLIVAIGTVLTLFNAAMYGYLAGIFPRAGGDYVYLSRVVSPWFGFTANWGFTWSQFLGLGLYASFTVNFGVSIAFATLGNVLDNQTLISWSETTTEEWPTFLIASAILVLVAVVLMLPPRWIRNLFAGSFVLAMIGSFVTLIVLFTTSHSEFVASFNQFMSKNADGQTYQGIINAAHHAGMSVGSATFYGALLALPLGYWIYIGFTYSAYIGGEVREPSRTQPRMLIATLGFAFLFYMICFWRYYDVVGKDFTNSVVYLDANTDKGSGIPVSPVMNFFAGIMTDSTFLNILMGVSFILWNAVLLFVIAMICTRNLFAWSFDRVIPSAVTKVEERTHAPWVATLVVVAVAEVLLAIYVFTTFFNQVSNYIVIFSVAFWMASWAAILMPFRRPEVFADAPVEVRRTIFGIPILTLLGVGNLALFSLILWGSFKTPGFSGPTGGKAVLFVIAIYVSGAAIYFVSKAVRRQEGMDLDLAFKEIPPE